MINKCRITSEFEEILGPRKLCWPLEIGQLNFSIKKICWETAVKIPKYMLNTKFQILCVKIQFSRWVVVVHQTFLSRQYSRRRCRRKMFHPTEKNVTFHRPTNFRSRACQSWAPLFLPCDNITARRTTSKRSSLVFPSFLDSELGSFHFYRAVRVPRVWK